MRFGLSVISYSPDAQEALNAANALAGRLGSEHVEPEHLLYGLASLATARAGHLLREFGVSSERVESELRSRDAESLAVLAIDAQRVSTALEAAAGSDGVADASRPVRPKPLWVLGRTPVPDTPANRVFAQVQEVVKQRTRRVRNVVSAEDLLLALLTVRTSCLGFLGELGIDAAALRSRLAVA